MNREDLRNILAFTASITTIFQSLAGTLVCLKIVQKKSTGDLSGLPFISGFLAASSWLGYGFLIGDPTLIFVNTVGTALNFSYASLFCFFSIKKTVVLRQFVGSVFGIITLLLYLVNGFSTEISIKYVGFLSCALTIMFFAAPLTSLMYIIRVKSADSLPFPIILMTFIVTIQWFFYGALLHDYFIQIPNILGCLLSGFQLFLFWIYSKSSAVTYTPVQNL
ncbi:hypothetical protein PPYR_11382 [Photinus pyralis]|uniref:Sugar transporter SWEET n=1 Tax=Photinus pyralis TaxID=7054 RepID=A0A5N4AB50_PHOPY|nr:sugar transporter SWEET1 [Photinus pyralis]KAB0794543.1 hypothetical protein PPYR_11382 [Photinus pyralis]